MIKRKNYGEMSIDQLQREYDKQNDSNKKNIIKQIIQNKIKLEEIEEKHKRKIKESMKPEKKNDNEVNLLLEELINSNETNSEEIKSIHIEEKYKKEIDKDHTNNKLMERLNSELMFRNNKIEKNLERPYLNDQNFYTAFNSNNQIATIDDKEAFGLPNSDFTSTSILKRKF